MQGLGDAGLPVPGRLARIARRRGMVALEQAAEALRLQALFDQAGVTLLILKGATLARRAYGEIALRDAFDIDLLVTPAQVEPAWRILADAGYDPVIPRRPLAGSARRLFQRLAKDSLHHHRERQLIAELHWRISDDLAAPYLPPPDRRQVVDIAGSRGLVTLAEEDLFLYLCVHGAAHLWARLKWVADIAALVSQAPDGGARYWRAAGDAGAGRAVASGLLLAHELLGTALPPGFEAPRSCRLRLLVMLARRALLAGGGARDLAGTPFRGWAEFAAKLLIASGPRPWLAVAQRILVSAEDVGNIRLPFMLFFLYPLLRLPLLVARRARRGSGRLAEAS